MTGAAAPGPATPDRPPVLALVGPTGSGKSAVAMAVASDLGAEIVAVDAFTVYRGMDVGTAKPSAADRARVPHHMVDVLDPTQQCTVQWFQQAARTAIAGVLERGRIPLLVGGSGLYFRAVVDRLEFPPTDPRVRADITERFAGDPAAAVAALAEVDPEAASRMDPVNARRAIRALEVLALTGRQFSEWRHAWDEWHSIYDGLRVVGLHVERPALVETLDRRVDAMFAAGLIDECRRLATLDLSETASQAIGYAEVLVALRSRGDLGPLGDAVERTKVRTRRYAGRQTRWFAGDPRVQWVTVPDAPEVLRCAL